VGSCGTMVLITELNLRLVPRPPTAATVAAVLRPAAVESVVAALAAADCAPVACTLLQGGFLSAWRELLPPAAADAVCVVLRFEGRDGVVEPQVEVAAHVTGGALVDPQRGAALDAALRQACEPQSRGVLWRIRALPTALAAVLAACGEAWGTSAGGLGFVGSGEVLVHGPALPPALGAVWTARMQALGARVTVEAGGNAEGFTAAWPDPTAAGLWLEIQRTLDPDGVFAGGAAHVAGRRP
jgi:FAD/FMN-containing dehydrogenase